MPLIKKIKRLMLKNKKFQSLYKRVREHFFLYAVCVLIGMYFYGLVINSIINAMRNFESGTMDKILSLNPIKCLAAVFTPESLGVIFFIFIMYAMYALMTGKWLHLITGVKITKDERNFFISDEGTHGTSGWMTKKEQDKVLQSGTADGLPCPILCKIKDNSYADNKYVGLRTDTGLNSHTMVRPGYLYVRLPNGGKHIGV